ncbi:hypothetical protein LCGC14_1729390 [marine sediment metagenome]|uniref:Uncharacterized protein n=1 Tax=marine sediment metagenome TaxID=412755 RepID=A0A0F9K9S0_9ZZZZ
MATLVQNITITEFRKLKVTQMKELNSCEVYSDGEYLFTFINGNHEATGNIRDNVEQWASTSNTVGGKTIEELLEVEVAAL